jgi:hypothetical protein
MKIVFLGRLDTHEEHDHIAELREDESNDVWVAPMDRLNYEHAAQAICNADEIHVWLSTGFSGSVMSFYLGMAYMFEWANLGQNVSYEIKLFNEENLPGSVLGNIWRG